MSWYLWPELYYYVCPSKMCPLRKPLFCLKCKSIGLIPGEYYHFLQLFTLLNRLNTKLNELILNFCLGMACDVKAQFVLSGNKFVKIVQKFNVMKSWEIWYKLSIYELDWWSIFPQTVYFDSWEHIFFQSLWDHHIMLIISWFSIAFIRWILCIKFKVKITWNKCMRTVAYRYITSCCISLTSISL